MAHSIARTSAPIPAVGGGDAGALSLEDTSRTEWDIVMTRDQRWVTCRAGITDPDELARELEWFQLGSPSTSVTYHVLERVITLRERLLETPAPLGCFRRGRRRSSGRSSNRTGGVPAGGLAPAGQEDAPAEAVAGSSAPAEPSEPGESAEPGTPAEASELPIAPRVRMHVTDPLSARCPSCRALEGTPCRTPSGKPAARAHQARGEAAQQRYFDDVAAARQRGITEEELHARRAAVRSSRREAPSQPDALAPTQLAFTDEGLA